MPRELGLRKVELKGFFSSVRRTLARRRPDMITSRDARVKPVDITGRVLRIREFGNYCTVILVRSDNYSDAPMTDHWTTDYGLPGQWLVLSNERMAKSIGLAMATKTRKQRGRCRSIGPSATKRTGG